MEEEDKSAREMAGVLPAVGVVFVAGCAVLQVVLVSQGRELWVACPIAFGIFVTNCLWVGAMMGAPRETLGVGLLMGWGMNVVVVGSVVVMLGHVFDVVRIRDGVMFACVMGVVLAMAVGSSFFVRDIARWKVVGMVAVAGSLLAGLGGLGMVIGLGVKNSSAGLWLLAMAVIAGLPGLLMAIPTVPVAVMMYREAKRIIYTGFCRVCAYDLRGTVEAGGKECPECGEAIWEIKKKVRPRCVRCRRDLEDVLEEGRTRCPDCGVVILKRGE